MIIKSSFQVGVPRDVAWAVLTDIERSAPCFPGAELGERLPDGSYKGAFNVKLGPMAFRFAGKFGFVATDPGTGSAKLSASGTDTKGRGGAQAMVDVSMAEEAGRTEVRIVSDVSLSGSVAQYGRGAGMIQALSQQLIDDFARNLSAQISAQGGARMPEAGTAVAGAPAPSPAMAPSSVGGFGLAWRSLIAWLRAKFSRPPQP